MISSDPTTLHAVAAEAGLSVATVSKILGGRYKGNTPKGREQTIKVSAIAKRLGYIANASARRLRGGAHQAVIVFLPVDDYGHPAMFSMEYVLGINQAMRERERSVILHTYPRRGDAEKGQRLPAERSFDGALVIDELVGGIERFLNRARVPVGFINADPGPGRMVFQRDERAAGYDLVHALAKRGYRRILAVGENGTAGDGHPAYTQRWDGITAAVAEAGLDLDVVPDKWWSGRLWQTFPAAAVDAGTAIVAMDVHTVLLLQRIAPGKLVIACCDDCHLFFEAFRNLTRVRYDRFGLGRMAGDMLLSQIVNPIASVSLAPFRGDVVMGDSTPAR
jgi:DNA-binding LacI/PurR family transcriptional regulator